MKRALTEFRVILLDQRGTGLSSPIHAASVARVGDARAQADYLACFRQEQIIRDCEHIRARVADSDPWTVLGQSWGGFLATHYLSAAPLGLRAVLITGGLPPLTESADEVYRATYRRVLDRNRRYFERYPEDRARMTEIMARLAREEVRLPNGDRLTPHRFQQLGMPFGMSDGFEAVHAILEIAFDRGEWNPAFLIDVERQHSCTRNPIYAVLHEGIYAQEAATRWAAERVRAEYPAIDAPDAPLFTGEMIYPWMFEECAALVPLREAANLLAERASWPRVYDLERLRANRVPAAAAVYLDDMYVEYTMSERAAREIAGLRTWVTNEYDHNGIRADGEKILDRLLQMVRGEA